MNRKSSRLLVFLLRSGALGCARLAACARNPPPTVSGLLDRGCARARALTQHLGLGYVGRRAAVRKGQVWCLWGRPAVKNPCIESIVTEIYES